MKSRARHGPSRSCARARRGHDGCSMKAPMPRHAHRAVVILATVLLTTSCGGKHPRLAPPSAFQPHSAVGSLTKSSSPSDRKPLSHPGTGETSPSSAGRNDSVLASSGRSGPSTDHPSPPSWSVTMIRTPDPPAVTPHEQSPQSSPASRSPKSIPLPRGWSRFMLLALLAAGVIFLIVLLMRHRRTTAG